MTSRVFPHVTAFQASNDIRTKQWSLLGGKSAALCFFSPILDALMGNLFLYESPPKNVAEAKIPL